MHTSRERFEIIRPDLEEAKKKPRPRKYDLYDIFCAVLHILREVVANAKRGWKLDYFTVWSKPDEDGKSLLDKI